MFTYDEIIGQPLNDVSLQLTNQKVSFIVHTTQPERNILKLDEQHLYVVRQRFEADGILHLVAAAKMEKEV